MNKVLKRALSVSSVLLALICNIYHVNAFADTAPSDVRALIYSSTAAELQWNREAAELIQVSYNGRIISTLDADSYFMDDLDPALFHQFEIRSIDADETLSDPTTVSFSSANFQLPVREVLPASTTSTPSNQIANVTLLAYSDSAIELFWQRAGSDSVSVEIFHNGLSLGVFDTSSLFKEGLVSDIQHQFELRPLSDDSQLGDESYSVVFVPSEFDGQIREVAATTLQTMVESDPSTESSFVAVEPVATGVESSTTTPSITAAEVVESAPPPPAVSVEEPTETVTSSSIQQGDCVVRSLADLSGCTDAAQGIDRINIQADLRCTSANCCPTGGALMRFDNVSGLTILGNGHELLREGGQRQCSLLDITRSENITLQNWSLDDDASVAPCVVDDGCPRMLHIKTSSNIKLDDVTISNGKSYVVYVQEVNGFEFTNSTLQNSGVLGMYIGHDERASTNIKIQNSTFHDNQTNGLALLGVTGSSVSTNIISNNEFRRNHWRGQWQVAPRYGSGFTGGGQVYIAQASGVTIRDNVIADGYCENCFVQSTFGSGVSGIEIAIPGRESVSTMLISNNIVQNHDAWGIFVNEGSTLNSSVIIRDNQLLDNTVGLKPGLAQVSGNTIENR